MGQKNYILQTENAIEKTYAQMVDLRDASGFDPGQSYVIYDLHTKHLIPNTAAYNTGPTEAIIVAANTNSTLWSVARSATYPQDILYYELSDSTTLGGDRGRIYYRKDTLKTIEVWEDWRSVKYRRWNTQADGLGTYTVLTDNGFPSQDFYMFNNSSTPDCAHVTIGRAEMYIGDGPLLNTILNVTTTDNFINVHIGGGFKNNTVWCGEFHDNRFGNNCHDNKWLAPFYASTVGNLLESSVFSGGVGVLMAENYIMDGCYQLNIGHSFNYNIIQADVGLYSTAGVVEHGIVASAISGGTPRQFQFPDASGTFAIT